ncbi:MAG: hypothetical protein JO235_18015 [Chroococcidiopsidaceae cyanobacterium CP_BM_RX_35]|nr:hypothetical protein [Chroococcidiopsidaceae cyanobacterium CP_BM_RX_35]
MSFKFRKWTQRGLVALLHQPAGAVHLGNGQVSFDYPPLLVKATTTFPATKY